MSKDERQKWIDLALHGLRMEAEGGWQAAEAMAALAESGMTQREIAQAVGVSQPTVSRYVTCWRDWRLIQRESRPPWREAYAQVTRSDSGRSARYVWAAGLLRPDCLAHAGRRGDGAGAERLAAV
jgi:hypothetical protein